MHTRDYIPAKPKPIVHANGRKLRESDPLTILLPVTRAWAIEPFCAALRRSDIPRGRVLLIVDAPGCEGWKHALVSLGFTVDEHITGNSAPPKSREARRKRHHAMRLLSQQLLAKYRGRLLCLEDDTIVPPNVYSRLRAAGDNATGVQYGRHEQRVAGIHGYKHGFGVEPVNGCGHYCLLTTVKDYCEAPIPSEGVIDAGHTARIRPLVCDWDVRCGHLVKPDEMIGGDGSVKRVGSSGRLIIGAYVHMYPPVHNAGAEHMLHAMLAECVRRGIECRVGIAGSLYDGSEYVHDGVHVGPVSTLDGVTVMLTHLDRTPQAEDWCSERGVPCVHIFHNHLRPAMSRNIALGVYNTDWLLNKHPVDAPSVMVHPPVNPDDYRVERGDSVTLINLSEAKGAPVFYQLASMRPDLPFLGVKGAYGQQVPPPSTLKNLTIMENQADVRRVYERTRVLLMPSGYESYGRCAIEACCSGIPVIAADTPGLRECLGDAGVFPKRYDAASWAAALDAVLADYDRYSRLASERAATLDPAYDVARFIGALETLI